MMFRQARDRAFQNRRRETSRSHRERGAALVEFAFVLPLLLVLVLGVIDFGLMINRGTLIHNATREGAREAIFGTDEATIEARVRNAAIGLDPADIVITVECKAPDGTPCAGASYDTEWEAGGTVIVETEYTYHFLTPITRLIGLGSTQELRADVEMRIEG